MNSLSWMIYAAEIAGRSGVFFFVFGIIGTLAGIVLFVIGRLVVWERYSYKYDSETNPRWLEIMASRDALGNIGAKLLIIAPVSIVLGLLAPSSSTIYMIAASEAGEQIVTSPDAIEMASDLKALIKKRLKEELGE